MTFQTLFSRGLLLVLVLVLCLMSVGKQAQAQSGNTQSLAAGNTEFALKLYQAIRPTTQGNLFYSPYSISEALAMTYAGARGNTARQMQQVLHFTLPSDTLHPAFGALRSDLMQRGNQGNDETAATPNKIPARRLKIADALWGEKTLPFDNTYLALVKNNYGAGLQPVDFINTPDAVRQIINDWVAKETQNRIQNIVPPGSINNSTRLTLANAIYFKNAWASSFNVPATADGAFTLLDNKTVTVPMMNQTHDFGYLAKQDYQAVELPYAGGFGSMLIIVPNSGRFASVEQGLDATMLNAVVAGLHPTKLDLSMPRFKFTSSFDVSSSLQAMGMTDTFTSKADFSGMGPKDLFISAVLHKAFVAADENGTEAAAATVVVMLTTAALPESQPQKLVIDRPFLFVIRDSATGAVLFVGRVLNPLAA